MSGMKYRSCNNCFISFLRLLLVVDTCWYLINDFQLLRNVNINVGSHEPFTLGVSTTVSAKVWDCYTWVAVCEIAPYQFGKFSHYAVLGALFTEMWKSIGVITSLWKAVSLLEYEQRVTFHYSLVCLEECDWSHTKWWNSLDAWALSKIFAGKCSSMLKFNEIKMTVILLV